ncbi:N-6 DNA methylase [Thermopolyspora sp. NPDC052614]|uniref:HsdM family class I SAM-dependent methyltransferase n=1 Tax=Thermopolyspora sp. NPDC052614 TaxID=3155682 RepID=UPI0034351DAC
MKDDATVNAGDIARLAGVGRAAVSNWRRRYVDFPQPVGGTSSSPLFSLDEVEEWLRRNGKVYDVSLADRVWQGLRGLDDDLRLGETVAWAGTFLLFLRRDPAAWRDLEPRADLADRLPAAVEAATGDLPGEPGRPIGDPALIRSIAELAREKGPAEAFEYLCERYVETHSRRLFVTRPELADLLARLVTPDGGTVFDPACGVGTLLLAAHRRAPGRLRLVGQEVGTAVARIAAARLLLGGASGRVAAGDSLRQDGFGGERADAVVCDPPFNERAWGYEELTGDPRWEYGLPPRGESELAWVQHCLAHVRPGGLVAILMPGAAAGRRAGRRIRANLLRAGTLRMVATLLPGGPDLWLLRRPDVGERPPSQILIADASEDLAVVERAWAACRDDPDAEAPPGCRAVRIIDLLDDEVDLSPGRHRPAYGGADLAAAFSAVRDRFREVTSALPHGVPEVDVLADAPAPLPATTVGELAKAGLLTIHHAPLKLATDDGELPVLTAEDVAYGTPPSGRTAPEDGLVTLEPDDVVTGYATGEVTARVITEGGAVLGPQLNLYRVNTKRLDPHFLAGFLRFASNAHPPRGHSGSSRLDARRARIPRLPLADQQAYGRAFRELVLLEDTLRETAALGERLIRLGFDGLSVGHLRPRG